MKFVLITNLKEKLTYHKSNLQVVASVTLFRNLYKQTHMLFSHFEDASINLFLARSKILTLTHVCGLIKKIIFLTNMLTNSSPVSTEILEEYKLVQKLFYIN